ncbi:thioredoxin reductase (NADPH) [Sphingopyxis sp. OAS728]|uniref:NAD(P)/FAD-dependent oxidoreductase n=1 Tax=Sphingopyxis sp. OAS728 TaxID=2663823 RepID=UPI00178B1D54|nr:NAD(P)/FAD-dependent oxidoreductase [Sphingopyxis sp. OAS728]MBE1526899.1 thioredoxin reductase (NADPH) [Sphingopyxis sp. OAS728]
MTPGQRESGGAAPLDVLVVGAGPAGLTAAMYLGRYRRRIRIVHDGRSRALWIPLTRNVPGFPEGVKGIDLIERMTEHARRYGATIEEARVTDIVRRGDDLFVAALSSGGRLEARGVILATGVETHLATLDAGDHMQAVADGVLRYCPICDGFEHRGERIAVLGSDLHGAAEAMFLRQFSRHVTLIPKWQATLTDAARDELSASGVDVVEARVDRLEAGPDSIIVSLEGEDAPRRFDILYPAFGSTPRSDLAERLGAILDTQRCLPFAAFSDGLLPGLYAAGDLLEGLDQISTAMGQGAMAATRLHNWLRERDGHILAAQHET